jgi:hypothetical protein
MLQKLGDHITACAERAEQCKAAAAVTTDPLVKSQLSDLERQWRHVAKSYEFIASLERFLLNAQKHTLPHEVEQLPKDGPDFDPTAKFEGK